MIPVTLLEFVIEGVGAFDPGAHPGSSLRGALYEALAVMYDTGESALSRQDMETNPVAWLMRLEDDSTSGGRDIPRPIAIRPPIKEDAQRLRFGIAFYGQGREALPMVVSAVVAMQNIGMGRSRRPFRLLEVFAVDPLSRQVLVRFTPGEAMNLAQLPAPPAASAYRRLAELLRHDEISLRFITPARLVSEGRLCHQPLFRPLVQRLLERLRLLSELYTEPLWVPFKELLAAADAVELLTDETRWQESWSHSRYDGMARPMGGLVGTARYKGPLVALLPYLLIGQSLQVGKNTIKGHGWYELVYEWA